MFRYKEISECIIMNCIILTATFYQGFAYKVLATCESLMGFRGPFLKLILVEVKDVPTSSPHYSLQGPLVCHIYGYSIKYVFFCQNPVPSHFGLGILT